MLKLNPYNFPKISIIIVGWNHLFVIKECLNAIVKQQYENFEVIFIDNASSDDSVNFLTINYPSVNIIQNAQNLGFATACNQGIAKSTGEFIFILNPDTILENHTLGILAKEMSGDQAIGICSPKIYHQENPSILNSVGMSLDNHGRQYHLGDGEKDMGQYDHVKDVPMVAGAAMFCRKKMFDDIGGFDEDFFAYYEDSELSLRVWANGWRCVLVNDAKVYHLRNSATKHNPFAAEVSRYYAHRNKYWIHLMYLPLQTLVSMSPYIFKDLFKSTLRGLKESIKQYKFSVLLKANVAFFRSLLLLFRKRIKGKSTKIFNQNFFFTQI